jgi:hypothetical protein
VTKGETVTHLNKINEVKRHLTMEMETIEGHNLEGKVAKIMRKKNFTHFVVDGTLKDNVGPKVKGLIVVIAEGVIPRMSVANRTK